jgi:hypothetical protein
VEVAADRPDDHLARVQANPDMDRNAGRALNLRCIAFDGLLHAERGVARPHRVILVGHRRAEERHDVVAHHLVHRALVPMNSLHHSFEHGIEDATRLLGVTIGEKLHRTLEVGEEHRHLLALSFRARPSKSGCVQQGVWECRRPERRSAVV